MDGGKWEVRLALLVMGTCSALVSGCGYVGASYAHGVFSQVGPDNSGPPDSPGETSGNLHRVEVRSPGVFTMLLNAETGCIATEDGRGNSHCVVDDDWTITEVTSVPAWIVGTMTDSFSFQWSDDDESYNRFSYTARIPLDGGLFYSQDVFWVGSDFGDHAGYFAGLGYVLPLSHLFSVVATVEVDVLNLLFAPLWYALRAEGDEFAFPIGAKAEAEIRFQPFTYVGFFGKGTYGLLTPDAERHTHYFEAHGGVIVGFAM